MGNLELAQRIQELRIKQGLSKSALAKELDVTSTCVWNWEKGNTYPRPESIIRLAMALGTTRAALEHGPASTASDGDATIGKTVSENSGAVQLNIDAELLDRARKFSGLQTTDALVREALKALIERESARLMARLGGSAPDLTAPRRRRPEPA